MAGSTILWTTVEVFSTRDVAEVLGTALRGAGVPFRILTGEDARGAPLEGTQAELQVPEGRTDQARALLHLDQLIDLSSLDADADGATPRWDATDRRLVLLFSLLIAVGVLLVTADAILSG